MRSTRKATNYSRGARDAQSAFTHVMPAAQYQLTSHQLKNVPKWNTSLTAAYDWAHTSFSRAQVGGDLRWVGEEWDSHVQCRSLGDIRVRRCHRIRCLISTPPLHEGHCLYISQCREVAIAPRRTGRLVVAPAVRQKLATPLFLAGDPSVDSRLQYGQR
jgi:hypothetical protein